MTTSINTAYAVDINGGVTEGDLTTDAATNVKGTTTLTMGADEQISTLSLANDGGTATTLTLVVNDGTLTTTGNIVDDGGIFTIAIQGDGADKFFSTGGAITGTGDNKVKITGNANGTLVLTGTTANHSFNFDGAGAGQGNITSSAALTNNEGLGVNQRMGTLTTGGGTFTNNAAVSVTALVLGDNANLVSNNTITVSTTSTLNADITTSTSKTITLTGTATNANAEKKNINCNWSYS
jgi:hypothetical protein